MKKDRHSCKVSICILHMFGQRSEKHCQTPEPIDQDSVVSRLVFLVDGVQLLDAGQMQGLGWWLGIGLPCGVGLGSGYWEGLGWVRLLDTNLHLGA